MLYLCGMMKQPELNEYRMGRGVRAFSSTRHGGYSKGPYAAFNINRFCGDEEEDILRNSLALCQTLDITGDRLVMPHQIHETHIVDIDEQFLALDTAERREHLEGVDALMTNVRGVCIGVSTADCIPVLLYDPEKQAVSAIHAGWRGTVKRIVEKAVTAMVKSYGTQPSDIIAQIGPGIHLDSFEVGDEVYETFLNEGFDMTAISKRYPTVDGMGEKWHIDLPECNHRQLMAAGIPSNHIAMSPVCTFQQSADYFSARRLGIKSGRIFTGIMLE